MAHEMVKFNSRPMGQDPELLFFGDRGREPLISNGADSWAKFAPQKHQALRDLVEWCSPGLYLEMGGRKRRPGVTWYANQITSGGSQGASRTPSR